MDGSKIIVTIQAPSPIDSDDYDMLSDDGDGENRVLKEFNYETGENFVPKQLTRTTSWHKIIPDDEEKVVSTPEPVESPQRSSPPRIRYCPRRDSMRLMKKFNSMFVVSSDDEDPICKLPSPSPTITEGKETSTSEEEGLKDASNLTELTVVDPRSHKLSESAEARRYARDWLTLSNIPRRQYTSMSQQSMREQENKTNENNNYTRKILPYYTYDNLTAVSPSTNPINTE